MHNGSNDIANLGQPDEMAFYAPTNEVFISDGYGNRRIIVFDANTGAYKRHWGAYGNKPDDVVRERRRIRDLAIRSSTRCTPCASLAMDSSTWRTG